MKERKKNYKIHNQVIELINETFISNKYKQGCCWCMYKKLQRKFKSAIPYYDGNHIITRINNRYYDITGEVQKNNSIPFYGFHSLKSERRIISNWEKFCNQINL